jgi:glutaredoxin 3
MADGNGTRITMYTTDPCGFCRQAKALLAARGLAYEEINLAKDPVGRAALAERTGQMTFPQIVVGERSIGGFRELLAADRDGTLQDLLAA